MNNAHRHLAATVAAAVIVLAACSASDSEPAPLDTEAPTTTAEPPPTEAPTTPAPTTTETTVPDTAVTIVVTTTEPPPETTTTTTTTPPLTDAELIAEIEADLNEGEQAFLLGAANPDSPESIKSAETYNLGTSLEFILNFYENLVDTGIRYRPGETASFIEVLSFNPTSRTTGNARICRVDASVEYAPATPDRPEVITDDRVIRFVSDNELVFADDIWKLGDGSPVSETEGVATCP